MATNMNNKDTLILSNNISKSSKEGLNTLVIGNPASGKTHYFIEPNIITAPSNTSFVIVDTVNHIYNNTKEELQKKGYDIINFDPYNPTESVKFNPFICNYTRGEKYVKTIARMIMEETRLPDEKNDYFEQEEEFILTALILYCSLSSKPVNAKTIIKYLNDYIVTGRPELDVKEEEIEPWIPQLYNMPSYCDKRVIEHCIIDLKYRLGFFEMEEGIEKLLDTKKYEICNPFSKPTAVFIQIFDIHNIEKVLSKLFLSRCMLEFNEKADAQAAEQVQKSNHIRYILDEFVNIGKLPYISIDAQIATAKSRNTSYIIAVQTLEQIIRAYSKETLGAILGAVDNVVFMGSSFHYLNSITLKYISKMAGNTVLKKPEKKSRCKINLTGEYGTANWMAKEEIMGAFYERPLFTVDELAQIPKDECLIIARTSDGGIIKKDKKYGYKKKEEESL